MISFKFVIQQQLVNTNDLFVETYHETIDTIPL